MFLQTTAMTNTASVVIQYLVYVVQFALLGYITYILKRHITNLQSEMAAQKETNDRMKSFMDIFQMSKIEDYVSIVNKTADLKVQALQTTLDSQVKAVDSAHYSVEISEKLKGLYVEITALKQTLVMQAAAPQQNIAGLRPLKLKSFFTSEIDEYLEYELGKGGIPKLLYSEEGRLFVDKLIDGATRAAPYFGRNSQELKRSIMIIYVTQYQLINNLFDDK